MTEPPEAPMTEEELRKGEEEVYAMLERVRQVRVKHGQIPEEEQLLLEMLREVARLGDLDLPKIEDILTRRSVRPVRKQVRRGKRRR